MIVFLFYAEQMNLCSTPRFFTMQTLVAFPGTKQQAVSLAKHEAHKAL